MASEQAGAAARPEIDRLLRCVRRLAARSPGGAGAFLERSHRIAARYADGRVADLMTTVSAGTSIHRVDGGVARYAASDAHRPGATDAGQRAGALLAMLRAADRAARERDPRIRQVVIDAERVVREIAVVLPDGVRADRQDLVFLTVRAVAERHATRSTGTVTTGVAGDDLRLDTAAAGRVAAGRALVALDARPAPVVHLPVVVGPGRGTVLIHEACCHPLEGDEVVRGSVYAGRLGHRVAARGLTVVDDARLPGGVGSARVDDEGTHTGSTVLVDDGRLASFLTDVRTAAQLGVARTGNGRRAGFSHVPLPRMSNTCVLAGPTAPGDIIADTARGLYAPYVGGGEVVESTGEFVFRVQGGFLIENGRITDPVQETTVRGRGTDVLRAIDAVGDDVEVGVAKCGKFGQTVPVGICGPTLRIASVLVGGTAP